jgi:hypothetical protein
MQIFVALFHCSGDLLLYRRFISLLFLNSGSGWDQMWDLLNTSLVC